ncbi:unnamed protein product [Angiostrongylus costaricensis]|uniref:Anoctamin-6-like n=1 Tax=Angiostrongylus costaricensis TaxID=334426 RepID=A0A0R3PPM7_ANGCS|nr:unnamed protein product [Angiostrongylus costaricensis]
MLTEHSNDSSFLIPYCGGLPPMCYDSGAGEALCSLTEDNISEGLSSQTEHTTTRESTAEQPLNNEHQDDMQDEVGFFLRSGFSTHLDFVSSISSLHVFSLVAFPIDLKPHTRVVTTIICLPRGYNEKMDEDGSVSSSDDETYRILERQLKKKGEVVRFQPPRVTVHPRHYKRFGKMERCALAEFDYLQDISTDVSALQSSPEGHHNVAI